jgi:HK97 family phage prohead protease
MRLAKIERRTEYFPIIGGEIKEFNDKKGTFGGYLNYKHNIDFGDDRTMDDAFRKTLQDAFSRKSAQSLDFLYPYLWNHDYNIMPPGGIYDADEDKKGLYTRTEINLDMQMGRDLYSSLKMGTLRKQSMGYKCIQYEYVKENGRNIRNLVEVAVMEGSCVVFPMNDMAQVDHVKNRRSFYMPGKPLPTKQETTPALTLDIHSKDYAESYAQTNQQDWVSDLWNLWYPLRNEILTAFQTGDSIEKDVQAALAQFAPAVLAYVQEGIALDMTECLQPSNSSIPMMMSSSDNPETKEDKAGRVISAANHAKIKAAADGIMTHVSTIHGVLKASLAERQNTIAGVQLYAAPQDDMQQKQEDEKQAGDEDDEQTVMKKLRESVYDLAATLQFANASERGI